MTSRGKPAYWDAASAFLAGTDPVLGGLVATYAGMHLSRRSDPFTTLARAIVGQQISVQAAQAIWERFAAASAATASPPRLDPARVAVLAAPTLRGVGLSERKGTYLRDLAGHFCSGALDPSGWPALDDEALIDALCDVKGIGRWTAEMFLIFHELRQDVLPLDDIGLQKAIALHYFRGRRRARSTLERLGRRWRPYRSVATWYLWRSLDPIVVEY